MSKIRCYECGQRVEADSYALHMWNYHDKDIRHLVLKKKKVEKIEGYDYLQSQKKPKSKFKRLMKLKTIIFIGLVLAGIMWIFIALT